MNWELVGALGSVGAALVLGFLYARARVQAAQTAQYKTIADHLRTQSAAQAKVLAEKEEYIRELEKTVLGSLPAGKLADRLNRLFAAGRSRETGPLPTPK